MTNINKIVIVYIDLNSGGYMPLLNLFDYHIFFGEDKFIGIGIDKKSLRVDLEDCSPYQLFNIFSFEETTIHYEIKNEVFQYIGYNMSIDDILDTINNIDSKDIRNHYLETMIYYKTNQVGKKINEYNLRVKHFDDLINYFAEDFYSYKILNNNKDFSESEIVLETYLTEKEIKEKFKDYLL